MIKLLYHSSHSSCLYLVCNIVSYVSRGGSLRDRASVPAVVPGALDRLGSWIVVIEPGGAWERDRSFLSPGVWHIDGSLMADPRPEGFPGGPVNHSPGLVRISCCFLQLLHTQITWERRSTGTKSQLQPLHCQKHAIVIVQYNKIRYCMIRLHSLMEEFNAGDILYTLPH